MKTFIWVILVIIGVEGLAKLVCLATGNLMQHSSRTIAIDIVIGVALLIWGALVLHGA